MYGSSYLCLVLLGGGADAAGVVGEVESDGHALLPVYHQGQRLDAEVLLQLPLGVLQHLHGAFGLRQFCVQLGKVNLKLGDFLSQPVVLPGIVTVCLW